MLRYAGAIHAMRTARIEDIATATTYERAALGAGLAARPIVVAQTQPYRCAVQD